MLISRYAQGLTAQGLAATAMLLAGTSFLALTLSVSGADARSLGGSGGNGVVSAPNIASDAAAQAAQRAAGAARQTQDSLARAARAVQDMQSVQAAARAAAAARQTSMTAPVAVPNGLGGGGLLPNTPQGWTGANAPTQSVDGAGQTQVTIRQTTQQAILNWQSFNVGARTTLTFDQQGNSNWVALNRVNNATAPSQILGNIKADGHVYIINQSGIIFGGNSQVNVGSLIASTAEIADSQFRANGIYSTQTGNNYAPSFTVAGGKVVVEAGASIVTATPSSVTSGGGYVLMIGSEVENAGSIATPKGQTLLAAGDSFILRRGFGTEGNATSTTRGIELSPTIGLNSANGNVSNTGLIFAQQGDITLAGRTLLQNGALIATTTVNTRGTIHLLNRASDSAGSITFAGGSLTAILPELDNTETALDSQRGALIEASIVANGARAASATGEFDNLSLLADRQDQSRVEVVTGGTVTFKGGSTTAAQGGQIAVSAGKRIFTEDGALLDVSGVRNVALAMASNNVKINIQGNELRDSPQNRDSDILKNSDVWIDVRSVTLVSAGTGGYAGDRYYTAGGLLEVGGYLGTTAHTIGEWSAIGGTTTLSSKEVIAQSGAVFDISGGSLDYAAGWMRSNNLIGSDGRRYTVDTAPGDIGFAGFVGGFSRKHNIQGRVDDRLTETWSTVFDRGRNSMRWEDGYSTGRDAGRLVLSAPTSIFAANIVADTVTGQYQTAKRANPLSDGYKATQTTVAQNGTLALGNYNANGRADLHASDVRISSVADITKGLAADTAVLPAGRTNTAWFDADHLNAQKLGGIDFGTRGTITIDAPLVLADGGYVTLIAPVIDIKVDITARAGAVSATNLLTAAGGGGSLIALNLNGSSTITLRDGATIDVRGVWSNSQLDAVHRDGLARRDGGSVSLRSTGSVLLERGSAIDVSSGAALERGGKLQGGRGGDVTLTANLNSNSAAGLLEIGGVVRGYGATGGGTLAIQAGRVQIGTAAQVAAAGTLVLDEGFFNKGFSNYSVTGNQGLTVVAGAHIDVSMPVYSLSDRAQEVMTGGDPTAALELWTPPLYLPNRNRDQLVQRSGASLTLNAGNIQGTIADLSTVQLSVERDAVISVDPGRSIRLSSIGQLTMDGTLNAWGGSIDIGQTSISYFDAEQARGLGHGRSIWIGDHAVLDAAARAATSVNFKGGSYGTVANGGNITIGSSINLTTGEAASAPDLFVVVRPGAVLDASGTQATLDLAGQHAVNVASNGGTITLASNNGLYLDGGFVANAGGAGAAGGSLSVALEAPTYLNSNATSRVLTPREIILSQAAVASSIAGTPDAAANGLVYGYGRLAADRLMAGGFDNLTLLSHGLISFDNNVSLAMRQSLQLYSVGLVLADTSAANARVDLSAAYVNLSGVAARGVDNRIVPAFRLGGVSARAADARFSVTSNLLDIQKDVRFNISGTIRQPSSGTLTIDRRGFADVTLASTGDLRFLGVTRLETSADLTLVAAQVYPGTGASATVHAGWHGGSGIQYDPRYSLTIRGTGDVPASPYAVFGSLSLLSHTINQGGVLRAPLGTLSMGYLGGINGNTAAINLLPGSVTSTSALGLVMPYGGTVDGVVWNYAGQQTVLEGVVSDQRGVSLHSTAVNVAPGATIDLRGGGELTGAGFSSGRGGSVDVLLHPLVASGPAYSAYSSSGNQVYAIVPGYLSGYAPVAADTGAGNPAIGRQITLDGNTPGLPAGTYTLMPSTYALLPGAFRVEISAADSRGLASAVSLSNGSFIASGRLGIAHTGISDSLARQVILTPGTKVRSHSSYNEMTYVDYVRADAGRLGVPRAMLPLDGKNLFFELTDGAGSNALRFDGAVDFSAATGGFAGSAVFYPAGSGKFEILAAGQAPTAGFNGVSLYADAVNRLGASRLIIGAPALVKYGQAGNYFTFTQTAGSNSIFLRQGAVLSAAEVFLVTGKTAGSIVIEAGAGINTIGMGKTPFDSRDGFIFTPGRIDGTTANSMVVVSNGWIDVLPVNPSSEGSGSILIGACGAGDCSAPTTLYSEGTIAFATTNRFELGDNVRYGTRNLSLAVGAINVGNGATLAAAAAANVLPSGLTLNQQVLDRLLRGDTSTGAPALENLLLTARDAINFFGSVTLDTYDAATGKSRLQQLVLGTPAIYGYGAAGDVATIRTESLIWSGSMAAPGSVVAGGAGTGSGALDIVAERIAFGYGPNTQPSGVTREQRLALGFGSVNLIASDRVTANHKGSLNIYQSQGAYVAGSGFSYSGGNLNITSRMVTGEAGSVNAITAGGAIRVGGAAGTLPQINQLGGELTLNGDSITIDSAVVLPSGKLTLSARGDIMLTDAALLDLAGRTIGFNDATKYSWGGDVILESRDGNIRQAAGAVIDLSAKYNNAGRVRAVAVNVTAGIVDLQGVIRGATSGYYNAGGTVVPYRNGGVDIRAQQLGGAGTLSEQFTALNQRLNDGHVFGARGFQLKQGDLIVGDGVRAAEVDISVDNGHLTVTGTIDASGAEVGAINLAGGNGLTLTGSAVLDAHGKTLRVDSYGEIIDSPNRAVVELSSGTGLLTLASGARIDLRHGTNAPVGSGAGQNDGVARGTLELDAPRIGSNGQTSDADAATYGDVAIAAGGSITIQGARTIAVNAVKRYGDADLNEGTVPVASGRPYKFIDQAWLKNKHDDNDLFVDAALARTALMSGKLAGLNTAVYRDAFHLRPGVEIATTGDLVVQGDLDLSGYRYNSVNPNFPRNGVYGSGEVGRLMLRAGGDLNIYGSINDGFAPPPVTPDDDGWILRPGNLSYGGDLIVPNAGVVLADGTLFPSGRVLNYDLPIKALTVAAGVRLPAETTLNVAVVLPAFTILAAPVYAANGTLLYAAGTRLATDVSLQKDTRLGAGFVAAGNTQIAAMIWPRDVALPTTVTQNNDKPTVTLDGTVAVPMGGLIPSETNIKLPAGTMVASLRPVDGSGNQGRNWAVAEMLAPGSQSWSMRLVGGADIAAADTRAVRPRDTAGRLVLADKHYSVFDKHEITVIPGTPARPGGMWYWNEFGGELGYPVGTPVDPGDEGLCDEGACVRVNYVWGAIGPGFGFPEGSPVAPDYESFCDDPGNCVAIGTPIPGTPSQTIIGALIDRMPATPAFSVVRTGTGDLDLISGGDLLMTSPYGVYTAGTQSRGVSAQHNQARLTASDGSVLGASADAYKSLVQSSGNGDLYQAWYPELGGNLLLKAGGNLTGDIWASGGSYLADGNRVAQRDSADPANWLWRQGNVGGTTSGAAWWINFGTYVRRTPGSSDPIQEMPYLVGFTGYGTLGGGDLRVEAGGTAAARGAGNSVTGLNQTLFPRSEGLVLAVASTGRAGPGGTLTLTGGGDMDVRIGGSLNSNDILQPTARSLEAQNHALNGLAANLRGHTSIEASSQGGINLQYGPFSVFQDLRETRAYDPFKSGQAIAGGGLMLMPGDSTFTLSSRGDLVLGGVRDAGMLFSIDSGVIPSSAPWFSLWTPNTAIDLFSAGGNLTPSTQVGEVSSSVGATGGRFVYPSILRAVAPSGSIYLGASAVSRLNTATNFSLVLAPSRNGELEFLAGDSIYAGGYTVSRSGADPAVMPTVLSPATATNLSSLTLPFTQNLFAFGPNTASGLFDLAPAKFYALSGDVVGLQTGSIVSVSSAFGASIGLLNRTFYEGAGAVSIRAGRDIVSSGNYLGESTILPYAGTVSSIGTGNLFVHNSPDDVSVVLAGRDILHSSFTVAGPGTLEISAGRNLLMEGKASVTSIGAVVSGDSRPGASIAMIAGVGAAGPDYAKLAALYLDPANLAATAKPLAEQAGKVAKTYESELVTWLKERNGFSGSVEEVRAAFAALPSEQQRIFLRQVYFAELRAGGREYNDTASSRYGSYLRGRQMIATLFPDRDAQGNPIARSGDITMFGGAGVRSNFGGDIQMMAPSGKVVIGVDGTVPPSTAGIVTQGRGDIQIYSQGSVLLGLSRIMTTFGGNIFAWSASGDINAGRGSKTTVLYTPPKRVYDIYGNVTLSPQVPSSGAGIATLNPIPEVRAGDIDLIAPLGTIDAGEAGIRVSGNVNLAALQIVNAANIQVQGSSSGIPTVQAPSITAALSSSNANTATQQTATPTQATNNNPSVIIVEVLGYGGGEGSSPADSEDAKRSKRTERSYDHNSAFQVVGVGELNETEKQNLSVSERRSLNTR